MSVVLATAAVSVVVDTSARLGVGVVWSAAGTSGIFVGTDGASVEGLEVGTGSVVLSGIDVDDWLELISLEDDVKSKPGPSVAIVGEVVGSVVL